MENHSDQKRFITASIHVIDLVGRAAGKGSWLLYSNFIFWCHYPM